MIRHQSGKDLSDWSVARSKLGRTSIGFGERRSPVIRWGAPRTMDWEPGAPILGFEAGNFAARGPLAATLLSLAATARFRSVRTLLLRGTLFPLSQLCFLSIAATGNASRRFR